ncbi:solute carrier family 41 member 1 [Trichonephila clavipes]|nr:solute carrier family 41 member 1 [Trichonephila clavipes]
MTLASRLSTQANLGHMDTTKEQWKMATGNMALIQCQAIVVGFLASVFAMIMDWIPEGQFNLEHALLLCAASIVTASLASFILGCVMVGVVIISRKCHINPDNVATPIAASLGDLTTLSLLAGICNVLFGQLGWYKSDIIRFRIRIDYNLLFRINELHLLNADSKYRIWWISESPSSRAQIGRTTILLIDLRVSPDPVCRMATLLVPSVPGMSFSILAMGQERGGLLSSDIRTRLPTCTSDWEAFHLGLDW